MNDLEFIQKEMTLINRHNLVNARIGVLVDRWRTTALELGNKKQKDSIISLYEKLVKLNERFVASMEALIEQGEAEVRDLAKEQKNEN